MKPLLPSAAALFAATTISVISGSPPILDQASTPQAAAQPAPTIRVGVDLVRIDVTVTDGRGRHVPDLSSRDFEAIT